MQSSVYRSEKKPSAVHPTQASSKGTRQDRTSPHHSPRLALQQGLGSRSRPRPHGSPWGVNTSACGSKTKPSPLPPSGCQAHAHTATPALFTPTRGAAAQDRPGRCGDGPGPEPEPGHRALPQAGLGQGWAPLTAPAPTPARRRRRRRGGAAAALATVPASRPRFLGPGARDGRDRSGLIPRGSRPSLV